MSKGEKGEMSMRAIECGLIKIITMKSLNSEYPALCDIYGAVLSYFINGLKIKEEKTIEVKKKIILNNIFDACVVCL